MPYPVQDAALAPMTTGVFTTGQFRRVFIALIAIALAFTLIALEAPAAQGHIVEAARGSDADRVVAYAKSHIGARFRLGTTGMRYFDCSGLVYRVYQQAGLLNKIGGTRKRAANYYSWFRQRGLVSTGNPQVGDMIWYTKRGRIVHMGLYVGGNQAISALINPYGVKRHGVRSVHVRFLAYGHTRLGR